MTSNNQNKSGWVQILLSLIMIILGIMFLNRERFMWTVILIMFVVVLVIMGIVSLIQGIRHRDIVEILIGLGALIMSVIMLLVENFYIELTALAFGIWALFNMCVHGLKIFVSVKDKTKIRFTTTLSFLANLGMALFLIFSGVESRYIINLQIGIYIILFGFVQLMSALSLIRNKEMKVTFSLPVIFAALIPNILIQNISRIKDTNPDLMMTRVSETKGNKMSVYLYAKDDGFNRIGHLDIGYKGSIYSYGAHDNYNRSKTMIYGDGVMILGSEHDFVDYAVKSGTTVFRFIVDLSEDQANSIEKATQDILEDSFYYDYPYQDDAEGKNYLTRLRNAGLRLDFYKFRKGRFKTYNVFTTNCVILADRIIGATGMRLFKMSGIATPGAYYEHLNNLFGRPGTIVVGKEIYVGNSAIIEE